VCEHIDLIGVKPIITDFANSICITPSLEQHSNQVELSGEAKVKLDAVLKKIAGIDVGGAAKYVGKQSQGILQSDLAKAIKDSNDCKSSIFTVLLAKLTEKPPRYHTELSDEKTTFCTVYMHQPSDNSPCSNCTGHCTAPDGGTVTRFLKRDCDGPGCGWSYHPNPQQGYNPDVDISQDGHSIVWRRRYDDASPQTEKYYFGYKTSTQVCDENCPPPNR
jgi:hypothetical protein